MGSASAALKAFMEQSLRPQWTEQRWKDKIAAGFTNSAGMTGTNFYVRPDGPQLQRLAAVREQGGLPLVIAQTLPLSAAADALAQAAAGNAGGAVVLSLA
jgi:multimeric flavodoxin WrbA